jgi:beta-phosphoglucomutase-like phosphatase (HAD superfamily)
MKAKPDPEVFLTGAREPGVWLQPGAVFEVAAAGVEAAATANAGSPLHRPFSISGHE